jgi:hypothetical protein
MGERARERVRDRFLSVRTLLDYLEVIRSALDRVHAPSVHRSHA